MTTQQAVQLVEMAKQRTDELFEELLALLAAESTSDEAPSAPGSRFVAPSAEEHGSDEPWSLPDRRFNGSWTEVDRLTGKTYSWPDGNVDHYEVFVVYDGSGGFDGIRLALGYLPDGEIAGLVLGREGGSERAITYFFPTDDFGETNEKISMIRGGGPRGRSGFAPTDAVPPVYAEFKVEALGDRVAGKWMRQAIVVDDDNHAAMLGHTAIQARLRRLA
jgi:hypothetical protein